MIRRIVFCTVMLTAAIGHYAAQPCTRAGITLQQCLDELAPSTLTAVEEVAAQAADRQAASEQRKVMTQPTGIPTIETLAGNSLRDFLTTFAAALQMANLSEESDGLTLDWNLRLGELKDQPLKIQGVLRKPELWEPFATSLTTDTDRDKLSDGLDDFDDVTLTISYSREGKTYGRLLEPHRDIFDAIMLARVRGRRPAAGTDELNALIQQLEAAGVAPFAGATEDDQLTFDAIQDKATRDLVRDRVIAIGGATAASRAEFDREFRDAGLERFSELINNQPQIYFSASARERNSLAGPRERNLRLTYEKGFTNVNTFRTAAGNDCDDPAAEPAGCAEALENYLSRREVLEGLEAANRLTFSLEHSDQEEYDITSEGRAPFHVEGSRKWIGSLVYGRTLRQSASAHDGRFDFKLTYEDIKSDDPRLDNRWIGSVIYTQKVSDTLSMPIGIVWASHEEDVPASDERLSAHFGLVFKMPTILP